MRRLTHTEIKKLQEMLKSLTHTTVDDEEHQQLCETCLKWGNSPAGSRGAWKTRGITDWNHGIELLKQHADCQWHRDAAATAVMARQAESGKSVLELEIQVLHNRLLNVGREIEMFSTTVEISIHSCQE